MGSAEPDQILSVLSHSREPGRLSKLAAVRKWWNRKKYKSKMPWSNCARAESHCVRNQITFQLSRGAQGQHQKAKLLWYSGGSEREQDDAVEQLFPGICPLSTEFLIFSVSVRISDCDRVIYVTVQHRLGLSKKIKSNGCKHQSKKKVSKMGSCWVFLEDEMKLGLCKFKLGRNLLFLINWWILQRFYFINIKTLCKR